MEVEIEVPLKLVGTGEHNQRFFGCGVNGQTYSAQVLEMEGSGMEHDELRVIEWPSKNGGHPTYLLARVTFEGGVHTNWATLDEFDSLDEIRTALEKPPILETSFPQDTSVEDWMKALSVTREDRAARLAKVSALPMKEVARVVEKET